jgi:LemA protein
MNIYIVPAVIIVLLLYVLVTYNRLISLRNRVNEAFSTMDVYLKKRWDLIPNIVETVKGYARHEKNTLEAVVDLRKRAYDKMSQNDKIAANGVMTDALSKLMVLVEDYPDLKANQNFLDLSTELAKVEEDIANSRKYYNAVVRIYANNVQMFPGSIIAYLFGFKEKAMFGTGEDERKNVKVDL